MKRIIVLSVVMSCICVTFGFAEDPPTVVWNKPYDTGDQDYARDIAVTPNGGYIYVAGYSGTGTSGIRLLRYDSSGDINKEIAPTTGFSDQAHSVTVQGNMVYMGGMRYDGNDLDFLVARYTIVPPMWLSMFFTYDLSGDDDRGYGVAADASGYFYICGYTGNGADADFLTVKFDNEGNQQWHRTYNSGYADFAEAMDMDEDGNIYVAGYSGSADGINFRVIRYNPEGDADINEIYAVGPGTSNHAYGVSAYNSDTFYLAGETSLSGNWDYIVTRWRRDGSTWSVDPRWYDSGKREKIYDVAVDAAGNFYVTGYVETTSDWDFLTMKYDRDANKVWEKLYDSGYSDYAYGIAVDDAGYVYVTGVSYNGTDHDFRTIKYEQATAVAEPSSPSSEPSSVTLEVIHDFSPNPVICYSIPQGQQATLTFYSADGRKLESISPDPSQSTFTWNTGNTPAGVYFAYLVVGNQYKSCKVVIVR